MNSPHDLQGVKIPTRIIVCGGRKYGNRAFVYVSLDILLEIYGPTMIIVHGWAKGADSLADDWCRERGVKAERHPADWDTHGRGAGPIRNREMAQAGADLCVAFPGTSGTQSMINEATACGINVVCMTED